MGKREVLRRFGDPVRTYSISDYKAEARAVGNRRMEERADFGPGGIWIIEGRGLWGYCVMYFSDNEAVSKVECHGG